MQLESELKSKQFKSAEEKTVVNIIYTAYRLNDRLSSILAPFKISIQQYNILLILRGRYPEYASVSLLKERMLDKNSGVSRLIEKLKRKGLVSCCTHKADRRQTEVKILPAGLDMLDEINYAVANLHRSAKILTPDHLSNLNRYLDKLRTNLPETVQTV
jgi:DNA-binding MarR family transcriptional regulator